MASPAPTTAPSVPDLEDTQMRARIAALTPEQRLELAVDLSRTAAEWRRAAWEAEHGRSAA
jgi:hypothetical protein